MNAELTELVFILDRSGSMGGLESDTKNLKNVQKNISTVTIFAIVFIEEDWSILYLQKN